MSEYFTEADEQGPCKTEIWKIALGRAQVRLGAGSQAMHHCKMALLLTALGCGLAGCSGGDRNDPNAWYNYTIIENIAGRPRPQPAPTGYSSAGAGGSSAPATQQIASAAPAGGPIPPAAPMPDGELYRSEASCGGASAQAAAPIASALTGSIALEMTECEVARLAGAPDKIDLAANERGQRLLTLTYTRGERPRIYRFASGRLVGIEVLPPPVSSRTRQKKK